MGIPEGPNGHLPGTPRRADVRHSLCREVRLRYGATQDFITLRTVNISRRGMLVRTPHPPNEGAFVEVRLPLPEGGELSLLGTAVRLVRPPPGESLYQLGIALDLDEGQQEELDHYLATAPGASGGERLPELPEQRMRSQARPMSEREAERIEPKRTIAKIQLKRVAADQVAHPARPKPPADPVLGVDFGTLTCFACIIVGDSLITIRDEAGHSAIPAVVWFRAEGDYVVGQAAKEQMPLEPVRTIHGIKRLLGCRTIDRDAAQHLQTVSCPCRVNPESGVKFNINGEELTPVTVAAIILRHVKECAERELGRPVHKAVFTYPLQLGSEGRDDLEQAALLAGLEPIATIPDAVAVALAYGGGRDEGTYGVYDFGGGSFSFSVVESSEGNLKVRGSASDPWLGGDDMDLVLARAGADEFWRLEQLDLRQRVVEWRRLLHAAEEAKQILSMADKAELFVPRVAVTTQGEVALCVPLSRQLFNELTTELVYNTWRVAQRGFAEAGVHKDQLTDLLLAGGASRVPAVRASVSALYGREPHASALPDRAAAVGAALKASALVGEPLPPGPWPDLVKPRATGETIGLAIASGVTAPLIPRGTPLPAVARRVFATFRDGQTRLTIRIVSGEERNTASNRVVGTVQMSDLPEGPAGSAEVEVKFEINDPDTLSVRTRDLSSGRHTWSSFPLGMS